MRARRTAARPGRRAETRALRTRDLVLSPALSLRQLDPDLWTLEAPLRLYGLRIGARMTLIRLPDGGLFVHSPVEPEADVRAEIDAKLDAELRQLTIGLEQVRLRHVSLASEFFRLLVGLVELGAGGGESPLSNDSAVIKRPEV